MSDRYRGDYGRRDQRDYHHYHQREHTNRYNNNREQYQQQPPQQSWRDPHQQQQQQRYNDDRYQQQGYQQRYEDDRYRDRASLRRNQYDDRRSSSRYQDDRRDRPRERQREVDRDRRDSNYDNQDFSKSIFGGISSSAPSIFQSSNPPAQPEQKEYNEDTVAKLRLAVLENAKRLSEQILRTPFHDAIPHWTLGDALLKLKLQADGTVPSAAIPSMGGAPGQKFTNQINVPTDDPEMNYLGLLIGPKGETQKRMQNESGAKIAIRGRGSSKDGNDESPDEPLHVFITADSEESLKKATEMVEELLFDKDYRARVKNNQLQKHAELTGKAVPRPGLVLTDTLYAAEAKDVFFPRPIGGIQEEVRVPRKAAGHIIGRGGETIRLLQEKTGAFVQVAKEDLYPDEDFKIVHVEGEEANVRHAKEEIQKLLDEFFEKRNRIPVNVPDGHEFMIVEIPNDAVGILIGKAGQTIKQIIDKTGAHVQVQRDSECNPNSSNRIVYVVGPPDNVQYAKQEIMLLVEQHNQQQAHISAQVEVGGVEKEVIIPGPSVGFVIGKGGETIKSIQARTLTKVTIDRDDDAHGQRHIQIKGHPMQVETAYAEIMAIVSQHDPSNRGAERSRKSNAGGVNPVSSTTPFVDPYYAYSTGDVLASTSSDYWQQYMQQTGQYYDPAQLQAMGYDPSQIQAMSMSYDPAQLQAMGYDPAQLQAMGYDPAQLQAMGYDPSQIQAYYAAAAAQQQQQAPAASSGYDAPPPPE